MLPQQYSTTRPSQLTPDQLSSHQISTATSAHNSISQMQLDQVSTLDPVQHCSIRSARFNRSTQRSNEQFSSHPI
ncbi:hypothetical protein F511_30008 [Dorcoceras hygrometricum]|uniref:Uncharacterized protein n=1 Tax=Dorcoceras hygrometricum TaxID=472368 RepID=A0A2Z7BLX9_9LAMI|nr:hypothetical protein F511_30008 [Dorcoceras hygrometricum]